MLSDLKVKDIKQFLSGSPKGREIVADVETGAQRERTARRAHLARELREDLTRYEQRCVDLEKRRLKAMAVVEKAKAALAEEEARLQAVRLDMAEEGGRRERFVRERLWELRETVDPVLVEFRSEVHAGWESMRERHGRYLGVSLSDLVRDGQLLALEAVRQLLQRIDATIVDGDVPDALAVVTQLRKDLAATLDAIVGAHAREKVEAKDRTTRDRARIEMELAERRRRGWPAEALREFADEEWREAGHAGAF